MLKSWTPVHIYYNDSISVYPPVIEAIKSSDYIFISPGDLFTSIIASLIDILHIVFRCRFYYGAIALLNYTWFRSDLITGGDR
jgi:hypothetical protein